MRFDPFLYKCIQFRAMQGHGYRFEDDIMQMNVASFIAHWCSNYLDLCHYILLIEDNILRQVSKLIIVSAILVYCAVGNCLIWLWKGQYVIF